MTDPLNSNGNKTVLGIPENIEAVLAYALGWLSGLFFLLVEKENRFVRFHAFQSLATFIVLSLAGAMATVIPLLGILLSILLWLLGVFLWIFMMVKAYQGERFKVPAVGDFVEKQLSK
jgi:uncharacterized membrane protein